MNLHDEAVRWREWSATLAVEAGRDTPDAAFGSPCLVARTRSLGAYPTQAGRYFACEPLTVLGAEAEGGPGTLVPGNATFFALNLGSTVPASGTAVVVTFTGDRWVFRHDG